MKKERTLRLDLLALVLAITGLVLLGFWMHKQVILVVNGRIITRNTFAITVGQFLSDEQIYLNDQDVILPDTGRLLRDGETVSIERAAHVSIQADGKTLSLVTPERTPANLLAEAGIPLYPGDRLVAGGKGIEAHQELSRSPAHSLQVFRAYPITLTTGSETITFDSSAATLGQALWEAGIQLRAGDRLSPPAETPIVGPLEAEHRIARSLEIRSPAGRFRLYTAAGTVGEALAEAGLSLQALDYSRPGTGEPLPENGRIRLVRVQESVSLETEPLPFETQTQPLSDLEIDHQRVVQPGSYGLAARRVRVRFEDGVDVSRQVESEYIAQEPQPRILGYGTKIVPLTLTVSGGELTYWRALNMYAVSYNPTSAGGTITASGLPLAKGVVAVDPNYIPLGTRLYIPGYGQAVAADTGGGITGRMIDLGYSDADYVSWHQWVTVYFLWPPPETVAWVIP
jgi:resuscitation-promoting factor RpfB